MFQMLSGDRFKKHIQKHSKKNTWSVLSVIPYSFSLFIHIVYMILFHYLLESFTNV